MLSNPPPPAPGPPTYRSLVESGQVVAGSPETVAERLEFLVKTFRVGNLSLFLQLGSTPHDLTLRSTQLFADKCSHGCDPSSPNTTHDNRWWPVRLGGQPASPNQTGLTGAAG